MADAAVVSDDEFMGGPAAPLTPGQQRALAGNPDDAVTATITPGQAAAPPTQVPPTDLGPAKAVQPADLGPAGGDLSDDDFMPTGAPLSSAPPPTAQLKADQGLGFLAGVDRPWDNASTWLDDLIAKIPGAATWDASGLAQDSQIDAQHQQMLTDAAAQGHRPGMLGEMAGGVLDSLPLMAVTKNPILTGAAMGALNTEHPNDQVETGVDTALGGLLGGAGDVATKAVGSAISPVLDPAVQRLKDLGVQMTSGQLSQGLPKFIEDTATSIPVVRDLVQGAKDNSLISFNRAVVGKALAPIGQMLPASVEAGHDAINYAADKLGGVFNNAVSGLGHVPVDQPLLQSFDNAGQVLQNAAPAIRSQFNDILNNNFWSHVTPNDTISADAMQHGTSELGHISRSFSKSQDPNQQMLGHAVDAAVDGIHDMVARANPAAAEALGNARTGWANLVRINGAAGRGNNAGLFSPSDLMAAVRSADTSPLVAGGRQAIARGQGLLQSIAEDAQKVLPNKVPDSGTAPRALTAAALLGVPGLVAAHATGPLGWGALASGGALAGAYTKPAQAVLRGVLSSDRPAAVRATGAAVRAAAPVASAVGGVLGPIAARTQGILGQYLEAPPPQPAGVLTAP